ncbi:hypothetical protein HKX48_004341 [Thoreauomyces humboldtii]|nr:hypothetical protein HKX48_004341 [Thoreauomyces humboldtii]
MNSDTGFNDTPRSKGSKRFGAKKRKSSSSAAAKKKNTPTAKPRSRASSTTGEGGGSGSSTPSTPIQTAAAAAANSQSGDPSSSSPSTTPVVGRVTRNRARLAEGKEIIKPRYTHVGPQSVSRTDKPRWYNQTYLLHLALRKAGKPLPRGVLIPMALAFDQEKSRELGVPPLFGGKTPQNTASGILTENRDKLFESFIPEGQKHVHFRLAYEPGDFDTALRHYNEWLDILYKTDWPYLFSERRKQDDLAWRIQKGYELPEWKIREDLAAAEEREKMAAFVNEDDVVESDALGGVKVEAEPSMNSEQALGDDVELVEGEELKRGDGIEAWGIKAQEDTFVEGQEDLLKRKRENEEHHDLKLELPSPKKRALSPEPFPLYAKVEPDLEEEKEKKEEKKEEELKKDEEATSPTLMTGVVVPSDNPEEVRARQMLEELQAAHLADLRITPFVPDPSDDIPGSLRDLLEVKQSTIPNAGRGMFAKRYIPALTCIGFYFGVPMNEDEFDLLKGSKGLAGQYAHRYRLTVIDATDDDGQPYPVDNPHFFCPFHFMNEDSTRVSMVFWEGHPVNQILCMTTRDIQAGDEIFGNYGTAVERFWKTLGPDGHRIGHSPFTENPVYPPGSSQGNDGKPSSGSSTAQTTGTATTPSEASRFATESEPDPLNRPPRRRREPSGPTDHGSDGVRRNHAGKAAHTRRSSLTISTATSTATTIPLSKARSPVRTMTSSKKSTGGPFRRRKSSVSSSSESRLSGAPVGPGSEDVEASNEGDGETEAEWAPMRTASSEIKAITELVGYE